MKDIFRRPTGDDSQAWSADGPGGEDFRDDDLDFGAGAGRAASETAAEPKGVADSTPPDERADADHLEDWWLEEDGRGGDPGLVPGSVEPSDDRSDARNDDRDGGSGDDWGDDIL